MNAIVSVTTKVALASAKDVYKGVNLKTQAENFSFSEIWTVLRIFTEQSFG